MVDAGRKHLEHFIQMNLIQQRRIFEPPYIISPLDIERPIKDDAQTSSSSSTAITTGITAAEMPVTTISASSHLEKNHSTLEQLQMQYQQIMTQMQLGISPSSMALTNYALLERDQVS